MDMQDFFRRKLRITNESLIRRLVSASRVEEISKGTLLTKAGEWYEAISFLLSGVMRGFLIDVNGKDITDCLMFRQGEAAMGCCGIDDPSPISIEAMTDCEVIQIPMAEVQSLLEDYPELVQTYNHYLIEALERHWEVRMTMYRYTAMQRYQWFLETYPGLIETISNKHIASFLAMTPVTLSRLRRRLRENLTGEDGENWQEGTDGEPEVRPE